ncbi:uncharacterized protein LOC125382957 [Haliotis rufescens]|uniref:uncharacterized protein LOC125382957 n=1 Tax=Haliotis rufescens TaxID=6454 RepID=UPI00201E959C|nr:uncharacterized protein LOC125382957 [Haliotis rufescens]
MSPLVTVRVHLFCRGTSPCADVQYRQVESIGMCVKFVTAHDNYGHQRALCEAQPRGRVVNLDTSAKIAAIDTIHRADYKNKGFFIGLTRVMGGDYQWTGGFRVTAAKWAPREPGKHKNDLCVLQAPWFDYRWDDIYCTDAFGIICNF